MADAIWGPDRKKAAMEFVGRVKRLLLTPTSEFARLAQEPETLKTLTTSWIVPLALLMVLANCLRAFVLGVPLEGTSPRVPLLGEMPALALPLFAEAIAMPFVSGVAINTLARFFGGRPDYTQAVRTAAYASTPGWLVGAFGPAWQFTFMKVMPPLTITLFVGALWGMYLLLRGLPPMMKTPSDQALKYMLSLSVVLAVLWILALLITYGVISQLDVAYIVGVTPD